MRSSALRLGVLLVALCLPLLPAAPAGTSLEAEKAVIEKVISATIGWALNKDQQLLYDSVSQGADLFIFHPDSKSTLIGFEALKKLVEDVFMNEKFKATDFKVKELRIQLSKSRNVAWYSAYLDDHGEWDGRPSGWDNARWTGVLEKRGRRWVIVQMHFSLASDRPNK
jgi:hypothetical protein